MIGYLKGEVIIINTDSIIISVNDVGYLVNVPMPFDFSLNKEYELYIHTHVREYQFILFGFKDISMKNLFLDLISVKGIGPKTALNILGAMDLTKLIDAINNEDITLIKKLPGIGAKSAAQMVLDLKGKLVLEDTSLNKELDDALEALMVLGYTNKEVSKISKELSKEDLTTEQYLKKGLILLQK